VDCADSRPFDTPPDERHVVIVGPLQWMPNLDAASWFVDEIWPRIREAEPRARCTIAGTHPPRRLLARQDEALRFPGFVEDYEGLLRSATVLAVPLRIGGGMRIKLLEFFAHGKAVVCTGVGAEGNAARPDVEYLRADTAGDFAAAVVRLLREEETRRALGGASRAMVERVYSWERIGEQFENAYLSAIA
jgi:polysaccharide biosynthesis protein PslH